MVVVVVGGGGCGMGRGVVGTERERTNIHIYGLWGGVLFFFFFLSSSSFCGKGKISFSSSLEKESIRYFSLKAKKMSENRGTEVFLPV